MANTKNSRKVIDAVHPGDTPPMSSSRPLVVTNRPFVKNDPMLSTNDQTPGKTPGVDYSKEPTENHSDTSVRRYTKDISPTSPDKSVTDDKLQPEVSSTSDQEHDLQDSSTESKLLEPVDIVAADMPPASGLADEVNEESGEDKQKRYEVERHIAAGTYFVPIGQVRRRRRAIFVVVFVVIILIVAAINVLLDLGIVHLTGIPHTTIFR